MPTKLEQIELIRLRAFGAFKSREGTRWFDLPREMGSELIGDTTVFLEG